MGLAKQLANHLREVHFGGNWTNSNLKANLTGLTWQQAKTQVYDFNTIAALTYHVTYYVHALVKVLEGGQLDASDEFSFNLPPIQSQEDWEIVLEKAWEDAENAAKLIGEISDTLLLEKFTDDKYGNYFRNINGTIEHLHYHLGQIVLIRKIILKNIGN